jgi:hypothetical protein
MEKKDPTSPDESGEPPPGEREPAEKDDERADREAEETFPASDPPANY